MVGALTNKLDADYQEDAPSRGHLLRSVLEEADGTDAARSIIEEMDPSQFNPFWLLVVVSDGILVYHHRQGEDECFRTGNGLFFLSNRSGFRTDTESLQSVLPDLSNIESDRVQETLGSFCASHDPLFERDAHCLHAGVAGTLSSSIIRLNNDEGLSYHFAQGPPCENEYEPVEVPDAFRETVLGSWRYPEVSVEDH